MTHRSDYDGRVYEPPYKTEHECCSCMSDIPKEFSVSFSDVNPEETNVVHSTNVKLAGWSLIFQRPNRGSRWYYGNFSLGLMIDSHPRFVNVIFGFVVFEIGIAWKR